MTLRPLLMVTLLLSTNIFAAPNIVVSIKPIHSVVSNLTQGITTPTLLLTKNQSPEHAYLKPSQLSLLTHADLAVFIHPTFESGLKKAMDNLNANKKFIIGKLKNLHLIENEVRETPDEHHQHEAHHEHQETVNYHLWLDINNMQLFAKKLIEKLIEIDPEHQSNYTKNLNRFNQDLNKLKQAINQKISAYKTKVLASYANTFDYFTHAHQLKKSVNITRYHGEKLSIFSILKAKRIMKKTQTSCLLATTEVPQKRINLLTEDSNIQSQNIDIIGFNIPRGTQHYAKLMHNIADKVAQCLK